jgi:CheY-like chemotaxis protein
VDVAENGAVALAKVRQIRPAVIVLDLMMPVMDGWTFLERCRTDPHCPESRIVMRSKAALGTIPTVPTPLSAPTMIEATPVPWSMWSASGAPKTERLVMRAVMSSS